MVLSENSPEHRDLLDEKISTAEEEDVKRGS
jgi:hypothetical protein